MRKSICYLLILLLTLTALAGCDPYTHRGPETTAGPSGSATTAPTQPAETAEPTQHIHNYFGEMVDANCTDGGYMLHVCACGDQFTDSHTDALGHTWSDWVTTKNPTETEDGLQERTCQVCAATGQQIVEKLALDHTHSYDAQIVEATCTQGGCTVYTCVCGDSYTDSITEPLGHSFTNYLSNADASCTQDGTKTSVCDRCEVLSTITDPGTAPGHDWEAWVVTKEPTFTEDGIQTRTCAACGASDSQTIEKLPAVHSHAYTATVVAPTCTTDGYTLHACACGDSYQDNTVVAIGHAWGDWVTTKEPTVTSEGQKSRVCDNCGATDTCVLERLPAVHEHEYQKEKVPASCTESGYTLYTCECGHSYQEITADPKGHVWDNWYVSVDPTTSTEGQRERVCEECGGIETGKVGILQMEGGFVFVCWPETTGRNMEACVIIKGQPGVKYDIDVIYSSGPSTAKGLENQVADENGYVTWTWKIGPSTAAGTYRIRVSGGGDKQTVYFTVIVE